ncbi:hypothetical protein HPP92_006131 [Vanilla planifolia]|uniref:U-box domain-containing protein n=1 Tax=Vanilla planifolia TaxID=51239 RepID=A0A835RLI6_VANPL|nr:hypothetical protein HPP92_006131 [Vanilla planifolia]
MPPMSPMSGNLASFRFADVSNSTTLGATRLTAAEAFSILSQLALASRRGERSLCRKSAATVRALASASDRNRRRLAASGAACVLAAAFRGFSRGGGSESFDILCGILSSLVLVFSFEDEEVLSDLGSPESLDSIVLILRCGDSSERRNAALVLKEIFSFDGDLARAAARVEGLIEELVGLIRDPISPRCAKAALLAVFHLMVSADEWMAARLVRMDMVRLVLESLVDSESDKRMSEVALAAFGRLCSFEPGRKKAYENALTMPVLVKKMFGVSDLATEHVVYSLWVLCKNWQGGEEEGRGGGCVGDALQLGAFLKLLMLLQVECREGVRERATDLLKHMYEYEHGVGCIDNEDFKGLRLPI